MLSVTISCIHLLLPSNFLSYLFFFSCFSSLLYCPSHPFLPVFASSSFSFPIPLFLLLYGISFYSYFFLLFLSIFSTFILITSFPISHLFLFCFFPGFLIIYSYFLLFIFPSSFCSPVLFLPFLLVVLVCTLPSSHSYSLCPLTSCLFTSLLLHSVSSLFYRSLVSSLFYILLLLSPVFFLNGSVYSFSSYCLPASSHLPYLLSFSLCILCCFLAPSLVVSFSLAPLLSTFSFVFLSC